MVLRIFAALLLGLSALAQAPLLDVTLGPGNAITIVNRYSADATAYVIAVEWQSKDGRQHGTEGGGLSDGLGTRATIAAGATLRRPLGELSTGGAPMLPLAEATDQINPINRAVIYADGATAGDPAVIATLLRDRGYKLAELRQAVPFLLALTPGSDFVAMARLCGDQALAENRAWPSSSPFGASKVFRDLRGEFTSIAGAPPERRGAALQTLRNLYAKLLAAYAASKPTPPLPAEVVALAPPAAESGDEAGPVCGDPDDPNEPRLACTFDGNRYDVDITNTRSVPATAVAVEILRKGSAGWNWSDTLSFPGSVPGQDLQPGLTRRVFGGPNVTGFHAAVIYADGVTAGDPGVISRFILVRAAELADLRQVVPILQAAVDDPLPDRGALAAQFQQRAQDFETAMGRDQRLGVAHDPVCQPIYQALTLPDRTGRPADLHAQLRNWLHAAQLTLARLESSLPMLPKPPSQ